MNKNGKIWLAFLIIPFVIGVLVLIYVPLHMILSSNPKLEQNFNGYKIEIELNTVRATAYFNSRILKARLQMPLNILSGIINLLTRSDPFQVVNFTNIQLNSAYLLADQMNSTDFIKERSMWYSNRATEKLNFDAIQTDIYNSFLQTEPLILATFGSGYDIFSSVTKLQLIIYNEQHQMCFNYPSEIKPDLGVGNATVLNNYYFNTIKNKKQQLFSTTLFDLGKQIKACNAFSYANSTDLNAVACVDLSIDIFVNDTRSMTNISTIQLSTYEYYFVRPVYKFEGLINPQIISNFSTSDLSILDKPINKYFELAKNNLTTDLFKGDRNYTTKIKRVERTKTFFIFPISAYSYDMYQNISFYMILLNNFARAELLKQSRNQRISIFMVVPSAVLVVLSIIISLCVLKVIIKKLGKALNLIEQYCSLIKRNDLQLQILDNNEADDMQELFDKMRMLNQMSKYSNYEYFNVPKPERVIKLLKCSKIFDQLSYGKSNLYQNLSQCYVSIGDYQNAIKFSRISIDMAIKQIYGRLPQIDIIYEAKVNDRFKPGREFRRKQHIIIRKILRFCQILYIAGEVQKKKGVELQITNRAQLLRKIIYPQILNYEYIGCLMFIISYKIKNKEFNDIDGKMEILYELIKGYQQINQTQDNCKVAPHILLAYWHSMMANMLSLKEKYVQAYQYWVESLKGNRFNPDVQQRVYKQIKKILDMNNIPKKQLSYLKFPDQYLSRGDREYLFLIDISNPNANINDINLWKKKSRKMADAIFNSLIKSNDRVSIIQFCINIKIVCNLVQKANRQKLIKKELLNSFKTREQLVNAQFVPCFNRAVERVRNLKKEKVFLIFLKKGEFINCRVIEDEARQLENYKIIVIVEDMKMVEEKSEDIYVVLLENIESVHRILQQKVVKYADNIAYIF